MSRKLSESGHVSVDNCRRRIVPGRAAPVGASAWTGTSQVRTVCMAIPACQMSCRSWTAASISAVVAVSPRRGKTLSMLCRWVSGLVSAMASTTSTVVTQLMGGAGGGLHTHAGGDSADHDLGDAVLLQLLMQVRSGECAPALFGDADVAGVASSSGASQPSRTSGMRIGCAVSVLCLTNDSRHGYPGWSQLAPKIGTSQSSMAFIVWGNASPSKTR